MRGSGSSSRSARNGVGSGAFVVTPIDYRGGGRRWPPCYWWSRMNADKQETLLKLVILTVACILSFACRLFSVLRFESVIHEFDPYFNYRTTQFLAERGFYAFHNWFDDRAWYPLGRIIGGTIYPGLMVTSALIHRLLNALNLTVDVRYVCVFLAPTFSSLTTIVTYLLTNELVTVPPQASMAAPSSSLIASSSSQSFLSVPSSRAGLSAAAPGGSLSGSSSNAASGVSSPECGGAGAGLLAAALISVVPGYISRSVAGSYDNEAIAIFCMLLTYWKWLRALRTGSVLAAASCALAYFYMVSSWGGYVFLINLIPLHVAVLIATGRFGHRVYIAYSVVYCLGTLLSMQIPFVGFQPVQSSEHMAALGAFGLCQLAAVHRYLRSRQSLSRADFERLFRAVACVVLVLSGGALVVAAALGKIAPWTGRFYSLLDPSYAKNNIPIIASVSEHQPTAWSSFYFDLQLLCFLFPVGMYVCFRRLTDANIFIVLYGITSIYFAGVMVRLMLVLAPAMCILGGIGLSAVLSSYARLLATRPVDVRRAGGARKHDAAITPLSKERLGMGFLALVALLLSLYAVHCTWVTSEAYSSPSIVLSARAHDGSRIIFDDFREAYYWLRHNTPAEARVMSWWDYGYQITAMANRTILVDNNTWNNTHISRVGQAMASDEQTAYAIMRELDVDYVLVIFGGLSGYSSDDINKFLWMVRIGGSTERGRHIRESDYYTHSGEFRVDRHGSPTLLNCLMYKLCYYRFGSVYTEGGKPTGYDRVRNAEIGNKHFELHVLDEAYTTEHWLVRIYKVKQLPNRAVSW